MQYHANSKGAWTDKFHRGFKSVWVKSLWNATEKSRVETVRENPLLNDELNFIKKSDVSQNTTGTTGTASFCRLFIKLSIISSKHAGEHCDIV